MAKIDSPPLAPVIPLRPDTPTPAVRGWHGMMERPHARYTQADWAAWGGIDPSGQARIVDVMPWSPAAQAGIVSGDWIITIDGMSLDAFVAHSAPVGGRVVVTGYRAGVGSIATDIILTAPPARAPRDRPARPATYPQVPAGSRLGKGQRLQWQTEMQSDRAVDAQDRDVAARLATKYADEHNKAWPSMATLASDLDVSIRTIQRSIVMLAWRGWMRVMSGRRTGRSNHYLLTWPAGWLRGDHNRHATPEQ